MNKKILSLISACTLAITSFASIAVHAYEIPELTLVANFEAVGETLGATNYSTYLDTPADLGKYMNAPIYKATFTFKGAQAEALKFDESGNLVFNESGDLITIGCPVDMIQTSMIMSSSESLVVIKSAGNAEGTTAGTNINNSNELTVMYTVSDASKMIGADTLIATWYIVDTAKDEIDVDGVTLTFNMESDQKVQIYKLYDGTGSTPVATSVPVAGDELNFVNYPVVEEAKTYAVTVSGGTANVENGVAEEGQEVTVTANVPEGQVIDSIEASVAYTDNGNGTYTFTMPAEAVTFTINYVDAPPADLEVTWEADTDYYTETGVVQRFNCTATGAAKSNTWTFTFTKGSDSKPFTVNNMPTVNGDAPLVFQTWIVSAEGGIDLTSVDDVE